MGGEGVKIQFLATLPAIQSALNISGGGDGARIKLDIPQTDLAEAIKLSLLQGKVFKVTIEAVDAMQKS